MCERHAIGTPSWTGSGKGLRKMTKDKVTDPFPLAMSPPGSEITFITDDLVKDAIDMSRRSPRLRMIVPLHKSDDANPHRMLNAMQPGSYIRPHRHSHPPKSETMVVLQGSIAFVVFDEDGEIRDTALLSRELGTIGVDAEPNIYHTFLVLEPDTVLFETKPGPYQQALDKEFAEWAPAEGSEKVPEYLTSLRNRIGENG